MGSQDIVGSMKIKLSQLRLLIREALEQEPIERAGSPENFIAEYEAMSQESPMDPRERYIAVKDTDGSVCYVLIELYKFGDGVHMSSIRTSPEKCMGKGVATHVMEELTALADKHGVELDLIAKSFGQGGLSTRQLVSWYKKFGFVENPGGGHEMQRKPRNT